MKDSLEEVVWKIEWSDGLSLGIPEIDEEHRRFISRVNELNSAIVRQTEKTEIQRILDLMIVEATEHFEHEERLLARSKYPDHARHAESHARLEAALLEEKRRFARTEFSVGWMLAGLGIKELLVNHLLNEDMRYREFLEPKKT